MLFQMETDILSTSPYHSKLSLFFSLFNHVYMYPCHEHIQILDSTDPSIIHSHTLNTPAIQKLTTHVCRLSCCVWHGNEVNLWR